MKTYPIKHPLDDGSDDWAQHHIKEMFPTFCDNLVISDNIIYSQKLKLFKGQKILLIGGGPSASDLSVLTKARKKCDNVWTMNNFFHNLDLLSTLRIDLAMFGANTQLISIQLADLLSEEHKPYLVFEPHPKYGFYKTTGHEKNSDWSKSRIFINSNYWLDPSYKAICQTAFWSRIGIGARMLLLAGHLEVKSVDFIGIDGFTSYKTGNHFFEKGKGKEALPSSIQAMPDKAAKAVYLDEYKQLSEELFKFKGVTSYRNLGANHPLNDIGVMLDQ